MGAIAAIGEAQRVQGLSLAGVLVMPADSPEQVFSERRQLFLTEQGYPYRIEGAA